MAHLKLVFHGHRWPAAQIEGGRVDQYDFTSNADTWGSPHALATLTTRGGGRRWTATTALAFWRSYAEMNLADDAAIVDFARRHGDPNSQLSSSKPVRTRFWWSLQGHLRRFAEAWDEGDEYGVSRIRKDAVGQAKAYSAEISEPFLQGMPPPRIDAEVGFALEFNNLGNFMLGSAIDQLHRGASMRRCDACRDWYEMRRSTSKTCSATCRNALLKQKGE